MSSTLLEPGMRVELKVRKVPKRGKDKTKLIRLFHHLAENRPRARRKGKARIASDKPATVVLCGARWEKTRKEIAGLVEKELLAVEVAYETAAPASKKVEPILKEPTLEEINSDPREMIAYVALPTKKGEHRLTLPANTVTPQNINEYKSAPDTPRAAARRMESLGFKVLSVSDTLVQVMGPAKLFESKFGAAFEPLQDSAGRRHTTLVPTERSMQQLMSLTWPEAEGIVFPEPVVPVAPSADPPALPAGNHHLLVPGDVARLMGANPVHQSGNYGAGVRVAMVDSGFAWKTHPFFQKHGYNVKTTRVPGDSGDPDVDANGHGTGESANFLAVAPKAELIGLRYYDVVAALGEVMKQKVAIVTNSWCTALKSDGPGAFWTPFYALLEQRLVEVAARGILIVFAAGNGHMSFTASLPYSISVGGVYSDANGKLLASSYASSYDTVRYASHAVPVETHVPEICGLCGMLPRARYILLPVPAGCQIDHEFAHPADGDAGDGTNPNDGWAVFSGTSAACPMVAGIIALILSKSPGLRLTEVRKKLYNSVDVSAGESRMKDMAASGYNKATGHGLANAEKSCS